MVLAVALAVSACHPGVTPQARPTGGGGPGTSATPTPAPGIPSPSSSTSCAERVLARMTEDQRVGQLFLLGLKDDVLGSETVAAIRAHHFGSVWFVKTSSGGLRPIRAVAEAVQSLAGRATTGRALFFVAANQEGGIIQALRGPGFSAMPSAVDQGALDPSVLQEDAHRWGLEMAAAGVNMNFAPVMDVVPPGTDSQNQPIGVLKREYGHDPASAGTHGVAFLRGMAQAGIATVAKHFPGMGRVEGNTDNTADVLDGVTTSDDPYLGSFRRSIRAGVPFVMVALATYTRIDPDHLAVFSPAVMVGMLRDELHFGGVVMSDDFGATRAVASIAPADRAIGFLEAGGDMAISKTLVPAVAMAEAVASRADSDPTFRARVDDAALRVLQAKEAYGLLPCS
jgi:beta-N-acetylhexosaminidase